MTVEELVHKLTRNTSWAQKQVGILISTDDGSEMVCSGDLFVELADDDVVLLQGNDDG